VQRGREGLYPKIDGFSTFTEEAFLTSLRLLNNTMESVTPGKKAKAYVEMAKDRSSLSRIKRERSSHALADYVLERRL
jgi:hypothetical protein